jgi:hypothetical protein
LVAAQIVPRASISNIYYSAIPTGEHTETKKVLVFLPLWSFKAGVVVAAPPP